MALQKFKIVEYDYDSLPDDWKKNNPNRFESVQFILLGKIKKSNGHVVCLCTQTGKAFVFDKDNLKVVKSQF